MAEPRNKDVREVLEAGVWNLLGPSERKSIHGTCRDAREYASELCDAGVLRLPETGIDDAAAFHARLPLQTFTVHYTPSSATEHMLLEEQCAAAYAVRAKGLSATQCTICVHGAELLGAVAELLLGVMPQLHTLVVACDEHLANLSEVVEVVGRAPCAAQLRALHFEQPQASPVPSSWSPDERTLAALTRLPQLHTLFAPWHMHDEDQVAPLAAALPHLQLLGVHGIEGGTGRLPLPAGVLAGAEHARARAPLLSSVHTLCASMPAALVAGMPGHGAGATGRSSMAFGAAGAMGAGVAPPAQRRWDVQRPQATVNIALLARFPQLQHLHNVTVFVGPEDVLSGGPHVLAAVRAASERFAHCADSWCLSFTVPSSFEYPRALLQLRPGSLALVRHMRLMLYQHQHILGEEDEDDFEESLSDPPWMAHALLAVAAAAPNLKTLAFVYKSMHATKSSFLRALLPALQSLPALETLVLHLRVDHAPGKMCKGWREECSAVLTGLAAGLHMHGARNGSGGGGGAALRRILLYCGDYQDYPQDRRSACNYDARHVLRACTRTLCALGVPVVVELCEWPV